ncbi:MAG: histidinol-phosphatase HisJ [Candidatus Omnitrophica bacterium]|nr:histidinol-phosphatase HisJ [Candidatus Omnitrophota bacterium]
MTIISDYHMHTPLCGHAIGEPKLYAEHALKVGLQEIGFSDHAPFVRGPLPGITMKREELPIYYKMIEEVQEKFKGKLRIKMSIEADFIPGYEKQTKAILDDYPYDYVIGSVHFIGDWGFDSPEERKSWDAANVNQVYRDYYALLRQSAQPGLFDIMGHVDLVKKFGARPTEDMSDEVRRTAQVFKDVGVAIEINTSGLRKPVGEIYPSLDALKIYQQAGVPLTFGSDAHEPQHVGCDYDKALAWAKAADYSEYVIFEKRKIVRKVKI